MGDGCVLHEGFERRLIDNENSIDNVDKRVIKLEKTTALDNLKFTMLLENLSKLPEAINDMKDTMLLMQTEIRETNRKTDDMKNQIDKLSDKVCAIDEADKISILGIIKKNIVSIIFFSSGIGLLIKALM